MKKCFALSIILCFSIYIYAQSGLIPSTSDTSATSLIIPIKNNFDLQAHQGGCGLYPCNTIPAFINAIKLGVPTLELDCVISKDKKVVVSHDQFMNYAILTPEGREISKATQTGYNIYLMSYDSVRQYDAGSWYNAEFSVQKKFKTYKPLLSEVIDSVEAFIKKNYLKPVQYNIEIKSLRGDSIFHPAPPEFVDLVAHVLIQKKIQKRVLIQSFDVRSLQQVHKRHPQLRVAFLVSKIYTNLQQNLARLNFIPDVYSPEHNIVTPELVQQVHALKMTIIPWTIDKKEDMIRIINMGVDGIITNYPDVGMKVLSMKN